MIAALLVLAFMLVVFSFLIPGMRPKDGRFTSGRRPIGSLGDLAKAGSAEGAGGWVTTIVGLLALSSMMPPGNVSGASTGAGLGAICALLGFTPGLSKIRDWGLSFLGVAAALVGVGQLMAGNDCGADLLYRGTMLAATGLAFAFGLLIALLRFSVSAKVGLQAFVVVELVTFLAAPLGVDLVGGSKFVAVAVAVAFGLLCGAAPAAVFSLLGVGLAVVTLWASTVTADGCSFGGLGQAVPVTSGLATYTLLSVLAGLFRR